MSRIMPANSYPSHCIHDTICHQHVPQTAKLTNYVYSEQIINIYSGTLLFMTRVKFTLAVILFPDIISSPVTRVLLAILHFIARQHVMHADCMQYCYSKSVHLSVCLSTAGIASKRKDITSHFIAYLVWTLFQF